MARGKPSASFTELSSVATASNGQGAPSAEAPGGLSAAFPLAMRFEAMSGSVRADFADVAGVEPAALAASLSDKASILARIMRSPALSAVALEILADVGGAASFTALRSELARRTGVSLEIAEKAVTAAGLSLTCVFMSSLADRDRVQRVALIDVCAGPVAALVRGITLPREAPPADLPAAPSRDARDVIALVGLTAHRPLKLTRGGRPNGTSLKSLIKGTGLDYDRADAMIRGAQGSGLLGAFGQARVQADALIKYASGRADAAEEARRDAWLPQGRWVSLEAAQRGLVALNRVEGAFDLIWRIEGNDLAPTSAAWTALAKASPWIEMVEHAGAKWLRRRAPAAGDGSGDGYVTPSFEVMLGPAAASDVVAEVALGCELLRVDHVLTFRLTPKSVEAGLAAGMDGASFLRALARVGPRGLPENVRAMVEDWIQSARLVRVEHAVVVRVAARSEGALASALGPDFLGRLGPGVLVVRPPPPGADDVFLRPGEPAIAKRLAKLGYRICSEEGEPPPLDELSDLDEPRSLPPSRAPLVTLWPEPHRELAKRLDAARANGFRDEVALLSRMTRPAPETKGAAPLRAVPAPTSAPLLAGGAVPAARSLPTELTQGRDAIDLDDVSEAAGEAYAMAARLFPPCRAELDRWMSRLPSEQRIRVHRTLDYPLFWAPYMALLPKNRERVLSHARSVDDAILDAWRLFGADRYHRQGSELMHFARSADLLEPDWHEALDALDDPVGGTETLTVLFGPPRPLSK